MKKAITKAILIVMTIVTLATVMPISANASTSNVKKIYNFLTDELGFNSAAACGILANIERESDFNPKLVIRDSNGLPSGGICQWNGGRFKNLKNYCNNNGYDYLTIEGQLSYLNYELQKSSYKHIYNYLKNVSNNASGAYNAAHYWCYYFEVPANRATRAKQRATIAQNDYWPVYGETSPKTPVLSLAEKTTKYDITSDVTVNWTSAGGACDLYKVFIKQKGFDEKTYDASEMRTVTTTATSYEIPAFSLELDTEYAVLVRAYNTSTGEYKNSKYVYFTVSCLEHDYTTVVTKEPTFKKTGTQVSTCEKCGKVKKETLPVVTVEDFKETKTSKPYVTAAAHNGIRIRWEATDHATAYRVYIRNNGEWNLVGTVSADKDLTYLYRGLEEATEYRFCVKAVTEHDGKTYMNSASATLVTATETKVPEISDFSKKSGSASIDWDSVKGADGYQVYLATGKGGYKKVATLGPKTTEYTVKSLQKGESYKIVVRSYVECSNGSLVFSNCSDAKSFKGA
ncbi:MAG: fibronectin type III domain-containing protein [Clostridia bacterium]|nr:fibronectin type III domain-containing protein [Clostridia bacterium]